MKLTPRQRKIDAFLTAACDAVAFHQTTPANLQDVSKKLSKKIYNPVFSYKTSLEKVNTIQPILETMQIDCVEPVNKIFYNLRKELLAKSMLIKTIGTPEFTRWSVAIYGKPSKTLVKKSLAILNESFDNEFVDEKISRKLTISILRKSLDDIGCNKWKIISKDMVASAEIFISNEQLGLKKKQRFSKSFIERLCVHEINTHVLRGLNGISQPLKIFGVGTANYLTTEEGLAVYNEHITQNLKPLVIRTYAGRTVAIDFALRHSFVETYKYMRKWFDKKIALTLTVRAKRGLSDTILPGACTKDMVYFEGFLKIKKFVKNGGDIRELYMGKCSLDDLEIIKKLGFLQQNKIKLPSHLKKN